MPNLIGRLDRPFSDHFNQMVQLSELDNANTFAYQIIATMLLQSIFSTVRTNPRSCCCKMAKLETEINSSFYRGLIAGRCFSFNADPCQLNPLVSLNPIRMTGHIM
jgi:hypothetical protein